MASILIESAFDPARHLSQLAKNRNVSPLKGLQKYLGIPDLIMMAGGLPNPDYFPFETLMAEVLPHDKYATVATSPAGDSNSRGTLNWIWSLFSGSKPPNSTITVPKYASPDLVQLSTALQYQMAKGIPQLMELCKEITTTIHKPAFNDWEVLSDIGNTDGWAKCVQTFCNPGEAVLCDEWTYPSALSAMRPYGVSAVPVAIDEQGMCSDDLRNILENWDAEARGSPRPHLMYIVPIGQNPTGSTMSIQRKKAIYDICVQYDVLIVEDDPYFFLQFEKYRPIIERSALRNPSARSNEEFLNGLSRSFLTVDYQGRVIRLDTFSKTVAPGCRLGWITCKPLFAERLERVSETSTQAPCGLSQTLVFCLLHHWKFDGFIRWTNGLAAQYERRRTLLCDLLIKKFDIEVGTPFDDKRSMSAYFAYKKGTRQTADIEKGNRSHVFSFTPPTSGMFVWLEFNLEGHTRLPDDGDEPTEILFFIAVAKEGLLIGPGAMFAADSSVETNSPKGHFRISYATVEENVMIQAIDKLASAVGKFYK